MTQTQSMTGGEAMLMATLAHGVDTVFGIPGAQVYPLWDAMARHSVRVITPRHEQAAAYMAMGYAKSTGRPGVFSVVPGPGVLNASAALCTAMGSCAPVLCLTGQVPQQFLGSGRGHLHELKDQTGTLRSLIKDALHISQPQQTFQTINEAMTLLQNGRPGPVSVEMCWDTMASMHDVEVMPSSTKAPPPEVDQDQLAAAAALIAKARKPMIMCGAGAQHASESVLALAERLNAPVTAFRSGRGVVAEDHPLGVSSVAARELFDDVDLLIGIGSRLEMIAMRWRNMMAYDRRLPDGPPLIRIEIDQTELQRLVPDVGIVGDADDATRQLLSLLESTTERDPERLDTIAQAKALARSKALTIKPQIEYLDVIRDVLPRDGFFVPEVSQMGFTSYFGFPVYQPRTFVSEGFQGTLGYGFQTALGVKVAHPDRAVVSVNGDGGFMFGVQELATAAAYDIGVVTLVFNNAAFGNVRRDQANQYAGRYIGADLHNPDFVQLAESFGVSGHRVMDPKELRPVMEAALASNRPTLIEVVTPTGSEASPWPLISMAQKPSTLDI